MNDVVEQGTLSPGEQHEASVIGPFEKDYRDTTGRPFAEGHAWVCSCNSYASGYTNKQDAEKAAYYHERLYRGETSGADED